MDRDAYDAPMLAGREILTTVVIESILPVTRVRLCLGSALRPLGTTPNPGSVIAR